MRKLFTKILSVLLIMSLVAPPAQAGIHGQHRHHRIVSAYSAILIDFDHNQRYFAKDIDRPVYPASTTKVLTAMVVLDKLPLDQYVTVSERATQVQPTTLGLRAGEQYTVRDLLYGLLLKSSNDGALVLAEAVAGSPEKFVDLMNEKAKAINALHSKFANPHGLPSEAKQFTTAYDMALIFKNALKYDFFEHAIELKYKVIFSKTGRRIFLKSHNKSLFLNWKRNVTGKTGYTRQAESCFVGHIRRGNDDLIIAVFGCHKRWDYMKWILEQYGKIDL